MEKRKWLFKRKSSEKSPCETESSGSLSSQSEKNSDDQEAFKSSPNNNTQSPEITSKPPADGPDVSDSVKILTEKLSAALVNVSAKDELVKQHAKVAEEAVAGWEKAENEVEALKKQLEAKVQQISTLEDQVSHRDGALKECVRQLRLAREEQEQKINEAVLKKTSELESAKCELEKQVTELKDKAESEKSDLASQPGPDICLRLESLERENSTLKLELQSHFEELEIRTIERDLSTQAAEMASKQHLESIKKVAKLEAECRRLKALASKTVANDNKSVTATSIYVESFTDSHSDNGERLNLAEMDTGKMSPSDLNKCEPSGSDSWASALIAELDQFKNEKVVSRNPATSSIEINLMDDFLEMERLAALPEPKSEMRCPELDDVTKDTAESTMKLKSELEAMTQRVAELEEKLEKLEEEKVEVEMALSRSHDVIEASQHKLKEAETKLEELQTLLSKANESKQFIEASQHQLKEAETKLEELQRELSKAIESKQCIESQLVNMEAEARTLSAKVESLESEVDKERAASAEIAIKFQDLEEELATTKQEVEQQKVANNSEPKIKQEDLAVAAGKLAECQKTIASLGSQLKSLATLEDFLIDTANLPEFSGGSLVPKANGELWKLRSNETFSPKENSNPVRMSAENFGPSKSNDRSSPPSSSSSSSAVSLNHASSERNRNGFAKFFSRTKNGIQLDI